MNLKRLIFTLFVFPYSLVAQSQIIALDHTHAHNDYKHKHPLNDALKCGFTSVEADVFLKGDRLIVAHISPILKKKKTIETLYLEPLCNIITKNNGDVFSDYNEQFILLIDIKTNADATYQALKPLLEKYSPILSSFENGEFIKRAVTIILSGNKPFDAVANETKRFAFIDENLMTMQSNHFNANYCPLASTKYSNILTWKGKGEIPENEKHNLQLLVESAHAEGKKVRLWASPENKKVWAELFDNGIDLINTDKLEELQAFLLNKK